MNHEALPFAVREERGARTPQRAQPKYYDPAHPPGLVAVQVHVPETASIWAPIVVGPGVTIPAHAILRGPVDEFLDEVRQLASPVREAYETLGWFLLSIARWRVGPP